MGASRYCRGLMVDQGLRRGLEASVVAAREAVGLLDGAETGGGVVWLEVVRRVEVMERIAHGVKLQLLAEADRRKTVRAGIGTWLAAELGYSSGRARGVAGQARRIGALPELSGRLTGGVLGPDQTRVIERAVKAAHGAGLDPGQAVAETLTVLERDGVTKARARVRVVEETLAPGDVKDVAARQRARSFLRIGVTGEGMVRLDALLDARRGTLLRAAIEVQVAGWLRARQYDNREPLPQDVTTIEQMGAQALTRLAEIHLTASDGQRSAPFTPTPLYYLPATGPTRNPATAAPTPDLPEVPAGCALTMYGDLVPADGLPTMRDPAARLLTLDPETGQPITLDGNPLDTDPTTRLATPDQRTALGFRDRHCTEPGCTRPLTWSLHAHHVTPFKDGGATALRNLTLLCPEHHILRHHPDHDLAA